MGKAITISKDYGCGAIELAKELSEGLGYEYFDKKLVIELAKQMESSEGVVRSYEVGKSISMFRFISRYMTEEIVKNILMNKKGYVDDSCYLEALQNLMNDLADRGDVVIVGRGGQCILKDRPDVVHVRLIAPLEYKKKHLMQRFGYTDKEAANLIEMREENSAQFVKKMFSSYWNDPTLYHVTINLGTVPKDKAIEIIKGLL
ncbi:MAG: cytidylate kinase-like family protein [Deltaproteobacteria bacterium]|nr:cytidylate kinase-like family protein [Deltaproteobacteria bacterium]